MGYTVWLATGEQIMTTFTLGTLAYKRGLLGDRTAVSRPVILANGAYYCDAPADVTEAADLLAGIIQDEAERVSAAAERDAR